MSVHMRYVAAYIVPDVEGRRPHPHGFPAPPSNISMQDGYVTAVVLPPVLLSVEVDEDPLTVYSRQVVA
jgi:hypothetical protein